MIPVRKEAISKDLIEPYFERWERLSDQIFHAHDERNGEAKSLMEEGIALFEELVSNTSQVEQTCLIQSNEVYEVFPINGMERFLFIKARPAQYACFRQLDELFKEIKKRYARLRLKV